MTVTSGPNYPYPKCENCTHWQEISPIEGICQFITDPWRTENGVAALKLVQREEDGKLVPARALAGERFPFPSIPPRYAAALITARTFICAGYKRKGKKP